MERCRHRQHASLQAKRFALQSCLFNNVLRTRQNDLVRPIVIGKYEALADLLQYRCYCLGIGLDCQHGALGVARRLGHERTTLRSHREGRVGIHHASQMQSHDLTEAVACGHVCLQAEL